MRMSKGVMGEFEVRSFMYEEGALGREERKYFLAFSLFFSTIRTTCPDGGIGRSSSGASDTLAVHEYRGYQKTSRNTNNVLYDIMPGWWNW